MCKCRNGRTDGNRKDSPGRKTDPIARADHRHDRSRHEWGPGTLSRSGDGWYISKPINGRELEKALAGALYGRDAAQVGKSSETHEQDVAPDSTISWDIAQTLERLGGDEKLFHEIVGIFLEDGPKQMTTLRHAIAEGNAADIEKAAHSLKGELGYLGVSEFQQKAHELEEMGRKHDLQHTAEVFAAFETGISGVLTSMRGMDSMGAVQ